MSMVKWQQRSNRPNTKFQTFYDEFYEFITLTVWHFFNNLKLQFAIEGILLHFHYKAVLMRNALLFCNLCSWKLMTCVVNSVNKSESKIFLKSWGKWLRKYRLACGVMGAWKQIHPWWTSLSIVLLSSGHSTPISLHSRNTGSFPETLHWCGY